MKKVYVVIDALRDFVDAEPDVIGVFEREEDAKKCKEGYINAYEDSRVEDNTMIIGSTLRVAEEALLNVKIEEREAE